ncbi:hypothetical protein AYO22_01166 [Fonsecaea multimorphosa]|nr:hypothetical protein AYO22_01166 [Fonsecaea multimorphosa]
MDQSNAAPAVVIAVCVLLATSLIGLCVNRVYFSPVAHVPGPLLAKVSYWYEFYYDVVQRGQYVFKIKKLHEYYGPIVRINPAEVHIADPDFYNVIYAAGSGGSTREEQKPAQKRDKWSWFTRQFGLPLSTFATADHDTHRLRREALEPGFRKEKVASLQSLIEDVVRKLLDRFDEFQMLGDALPISLAFAALMNDIVEQYTLGQNDKRVLARDFEPSLHDAAVVRSFRGHLIKQFPSIWWLTRFIPDDVTIMVNRSMASHVKLQRDMKAQIELIHRQGGSNSNSSSSTGNKSSPSPPQTIFHSILSSSDLPSTEKSPSRLYQDGLATIMLGTLPTATALSVTLFHLLSQPELLRRLKTELLVAIPSANLQRIPPLSVLEQLPFLSACVREGLRLSNGGMNTTRSQRIDPQNAVVFVDRWKNEGKRYVMPPGTPMSMTGMLVHLDEKVFPDPARFEPQRWLENSTTAATALAGGGRRDGGGARVAALEEYLVPFSQGPRQCLGQHLALASIYTTLAMIFRVYGSSETGKMKGDRGCLELFETEYARDVEIVGDGVIAPLRSRDSRGIRIKVK